jgi:glycosyltransferase involved in cell wall biosynthesis
VAVEVLRALRPSGPGTTDGDDSPSRDTVVCVLRAGGPLAGEMAVRADRLSREPLRWARALVRRAGPLARRLVDRVDELVAGLVLARHRPDVVYLNTVKSACYLRPALRRGIPTVLHVHELEPLASIALRRFPLGARWADVRLVACSTAAGENLARIVGRPVAQVEVIPSPVDVDAVVAQAGSPARGTGGETGPLIVGACGTVAEGKGTDLWLEAAAAVRHHRPGLAVRFRWVGRLRDDWAPDLARRLGVDDVAEFGGETGDPYPQLAAMDVFTLTSRQDAFPLVVLEAMALGCPVVAFDMGGAAEQLGDAGVLVPAGRPEAMAEAVVALLDDPAERARLGAAARERVRSLYDVPEFHRAVRHTVDMAAGHRELADRA